jgi:FkbM family methyltransferase
LAAPFLNRLQIRIDTAMEQSSIASASRRTEHKLDATADAVAKVPDAVAKVADAVAKVADAVAKVQADLASLVTHMELLRLGQDAARLDQDDLAGSVRENLASHRATLEVVEQRATAVQQQLAELERHTAAQAQRLDLQTSLVSAGRTEQQEAAAALMTRSERVAIPMGRDILMRTTLGYLMLPVEDPVLVTAIWETGGLLEPGTTKVIAALIREGDRVIDVGANVGLTVLPAARLLGPSGRIYAFEPVARTAELLERTLALNFFGDRVLLQHCAAGAEAATARLNVGQILGHSSLLALSDSASTQEVEVRTVDSVIPPGEHIRLAKLDAEGFEPQVWRGMQRVIADNPHLAVIVEFGPEHLRRANIPIPDWLAEFTAPGFTAYEIDESTCTVSSLRGLHALAAVTSVNLLLLRDPPAKFSRLDFTAQVAT